MEFEDKILTTDDITELFVTGVIKDLYLNSVGFFNKGTYNYPGSAFTKEEIQAADPNLHAMYWTDLCMYYASGQNGGVVFSMHVNGYLVNISLGYIQDGAYHLCNTLIRPDKDGTRGFMRNPEYHNNRATTEKSLGATIAYSYCDVGSPINDTFMAYKNHFGPIEECNIRNWNTLEHLGQVTQNYSTGGQDWVGVKSEYNVVFEKYSMEYY